MMNAELKERVLKSLKENGKDEKLAAITEALPSARVERLDNSFLNVVCRVTSADGSASCVVKLFFDHNAALGPSVPLDIERCRRQFDASTYISDIIPEGCELPYFCDDVNNALCMQDLPNHRTWDADLMTSCDLHLGAKLVDALVSLHSKSHVTSQGPDRFEKLRQQFSPLPLLAAFLQRYALEQPFQASHRDNKPLDAKVRSKIDEVIQDEVVTRARQLASDWLRPENATCLIHGDLHAGAVMGNQRKSDIRLIDTECARVGPEAFDVARLVCNYVLFYHYHQEKSGQGAGPGKCDHAQLTTDMVDLICITLSRYMEGMRKALGDTYDKHLIWKQILLFMGVELIAWISGPASLTCLEEFPEAQMLCLSTALRLLHRQTLSLDPRGVSQLIHDSR